MVFFNHATRQMTAKIVYYGPGLCGKTTNLNTIYGKTTQKARGEMVSLNTETDRTLFFDLLPMDVGTIGGFKAKLQLYTVPGQVFYNSTRKLVLKGVDGIVFVADSQVPMLDANKESLQNLTDNLRELGLDITQIPMVFQWNKRDLKSILPVEKMEAELNPRKCLSFQSCAQEGMGVFETLRGVTKLALSYIKSHHLGEDTAPKMNVPSAAPMEVPAPPAAPASVQAQAPSPVAAVPAPVSQELILPSVSDLLAEAMGELSDPPSPTAAIPEAPKFVSRTTPAPAVAPKPASALSPATAPKKVSLASPLLPSAPKVKPAQPKATMAPMLGGLSAPSLGGAPALKLSVPEHLEGQEVEIVVQVRHAGAVVAESQVKKSVPAKGSVTKLTVEMKRS